MLTNDVLSFIFGLLPLPQRMHVASVNWRWYTRLLNERFFCDLKHWIQTHTKHTLKPPYTETHLQYKERRMGHAIPPQLRAYLKYVSREFKPRHSTDWFVVGIKRLSFKEPMAWRMLATKSNDKVEIQMATGRMRYKHYRLYYQQWKRHLEKRLEITTPTSFLTFIRVMYAR